MSLWSRVAALLPATDAEAAEARRLLAERREGRLLFRTQTSMLRLPDPVIAAFYAALAEDGPPARAPRSDSAWMLESDFCYLNARAAGVDGRKGGFLQAAKLLPCVAADAIQLAPFHPAEFEVVYAPDDQESIAPELADPALSAAGFEAGDQLKAFSEACALLGKSLGFELLPQLAQFGRAALERPGLVRWIELSPDRRSLVAAGGLLAFSTPFSYTRAERLRIAGKVSELVRSVKESLGVRSLVYGPDPEDREAQDKAYYASVKLCIDRGLWPVLLHTWNGAGVPEPRGWDAEGMFPVFEYRDARDEDTGASAYGIAAPYAFHDGMPTNRLPSPADEIEENSEAVEYWSRIFSSWRDGFGFSFARYDSVERTRDAAMDEAGTVPASDRPTPSIVTRAVASSREGAPGVGAFMAGGMDPGALAALGMDLSLGTDMQRRIDAPLMRESFELVDRLAMRNSRPGRKASVCFAVDTHDSGDPRFWGMPLADVFGPERMRLRHFVARFASCGAGRRPMFEVMGFQDGSTGLFGAGVRAEGLDWRDSATAARSYATIEAVYGRVRPFLSGARLALRHVDGALAWWVMRGPDPERVLLAAASLETADGGPPRAFGVPLSSILGDERFYGVAYDFSSAEGVRVSGSDALEVEGLPYLGFRLYDLSSWAPG